MNKGRTNNSTSCMNHIHFNWTDRVTVDGIVFRPKKWHETTAGQIALSIAFLAAAGMIFLIAIVAFPESLH